MQTREQSGLLTFAFRPCGRDLGEVEKGGPQDLACFIFRPRKQTTGGQQGWVLVVVVGLQQLLEFPGLLSQKTGEQ